MAQNPLIKRYLDAGMAFTEMTRARAEGIVKELVRAGEVQSQRTDELVTTLVERSRRNTEQLLEMVRTEVRKQLGALGVVPEREAARGAAAARSTTAAAPEKATADERAAAGKKKAATKKATAKKKSAAKKKAATKKATAKKKAATKKKAAAEKRPATKKATAKKAAGGQSS